MDKKVEIKRTVYNKDEFQKVIKRGFTTFTQPQPIVDTDTVEELFRIYEKLFFTMPINGARNSHEYIVKRSLEVYNLERETEDIQPLLDEVSTLREQLLAANNTILRLETEAAGGDALDFEQAGLVSSLEAQLQAANATIASLQTQNESLGSTKEAKAEADAAAKRAEEEAAKQQEINDVIKWITVDNKEVMDDIIKISTRAKNKKKRKRLDDKRDTNKMNTLIAQAKAKFNRYDIQNVASGFNESPLNKRVIVSVVGRNLTFKLIPVS